MALSEVWWRGDDGEWKRTNAHEASQKYSFTIPARSGHFRCYKCFQYVGFSNTESRICYFYHSSGEVDKNCEDRTSNQSSTVFQTAPLTEYPLKLTMEQYQARIYLGIPPVNREEIQIAIKHNVTLHICNAVYNVDYSRFVPNTTTWFELSLRSLQSHFVEFTSAYYIPTLWKLDTPRIPDHGALFDARTGRRVIEKGDVEVGRDYYLLRKRIWSFQTRPADVTILPYNQDSQWTVYKITADRLSDRSSEFFFDELHMRLTQQPSDIDIVWPPCVQHYDLIDTKQSRLIVYVRGEQDLQTFPLSGNWSTLLLRLSPTQKFYDIQNRGTLQMICAERFSQTLRCLYIRPPQKREVQAPTAIVVMAGDGSIITDYNLKKIPVERTLRFLSSVDGSVTVSDHDGFCYRKILPAGEVTRLTDLKKDMILTLRQATKIVGTITLPQSIVQESSALTNVWPWRGKLISFPARFASILHEVPRESKAYSQLLEALRKGKIPEDGYLAVRKMLEGKA